MSEKRQKLIRKLAKLEEPEDVKAQDKLVKKYKHPEYTPSHLLCMIEDAKCT